MRAPATISTIPRRAQREPNPQPLSLYKPLAASWRCAPPSLPTWRLRRSRLAAGRRTEATPPSHATPSMSRRRGERRDPNLSSRLLISSPPPHPPPHPHPPRAPPLATPSHTPRAPPSRRPDKLLRSPRVRGKGSTIAVNPTIASVGHSPDPNHAPCRVADPRSRVTSFGCRAPVARQSVQGGEGEPAATADDRIGAEARGKRHGHAPSAGAFIILSSSAPHTPCMKCHAPSASAAPHCLRTRSPHCIDASSAHALSPRSTLCGTLLDALALPRRRRRGGSRRRWRPRRCSAPRPRPPSRPRRRARRPQNTPRRGR